MVNLPNQCQSGNTQAVSEAEPMWIVLHNASGSQRRRWGPDMAQLCRDLVERYGWLMWREGRDAHVKHRCLMAN